MLFDLICRVAQGEVSCHLSGGDLVEFCNLARRKGIRLCRLAATKQEATLRVIAREYKQLRPLAKACHLKLRLTGKHGLPFWLKPFRKRWGLPLGFACFVCLICFFSNFIWVVRVEGNTLTSTDQIIQAANSAGIGYGAIPSDLQFSYLEQKTLLSLPSLSWLAFNRRGSSLQIDVSEAAEKTTPLDSTIPAHLVADCDGEILEIEAYNGVALLQKGQAFQTGDILISGHISGQNAAVGVHALGLVIAKVRQTYSVTLPIKETLPLLTGEEKTCYQLEFFGSSFPLGNQESPYSTFDTLVGEERLEIADVRLPLALRKTKYRQTQEAQQLRSKEALRTEANLSLKQAIAPLLTKGKLLSISIQESFTPLAYRCEAVCEFALSVGVEQETNPPSLPPKEDPSLE